MVVTDDPVYSRWTIDTFNNKSPFVSEIADPFYTNTWDDYGTSYFKELWQQKGRSTYYHRFVK